MLILFLSNLPGFQPFDLALNGAVVDGVLIDIRLIPSEACRKNGRPSEYGTGTTEPVSVI